MAPRLAARISWDLVRSMSSQTPTQTSWIKPLGNMGQKSDSIKHFKWFWSLQKFYPSRCISGVYFVVIHWELHGEYAQIAVSSHSCIWLAHFYIVPALAASLAGSSCWPCNIGTAIAYLGPHETNAGTLLEQPGEIKQVPQNSTWPGWTSSRDNGNSARYVCWWC